MDWANLFSFRFYFSFHFYGGHRSPNHDRNNSVYRSSHQLAAWSQNYAGVIPCEKMRFWTSGLKIGFFGPKQVSWTAWGASGPILASPSHLRVNFHSWVAFWVCRAPKVPNKLLIPFFVILLSFLHPKGWNKSTFDVQDPKPAINSKN